MKPEDIYLNKHILIPKGGITHLEFCEQMSSPLAASGNDESGPALDSQSGVACTTVRWRVKQAVLPLANLQTL